MGIFRAPGLSLPQSGRLARRVDSDEAGSLDGNFRNFQRFSLLPGVSRPKIAIRDRPWAGHCRSLSANRGKSVLVHGIQAIHLVGLQEIGIRADVWARA